MNPFRGYAFRYLCADQTYPVCAEEPGKSKIGKFRFCWHFSDKALRQGHSLVGREPREKTGWGWKELDCLAVDFSARQVVAGRMEGSEMRAMFLDDPLTRKNSRLTRDLSVTAGNKCPIPSI